MTLGWHSAEIYPNKMPLPSLFRLALTSKSTPSVSPSLQQQQVETRQTETLKSAVKCHQADLSAHCERDEVRIHPKLGSCLTERAVLDPSLLEACGLVINPLYPRIRLDCREHSRSLSI